MPIFRLLIAALLVGACFYIYRRLKNTKLNYVKRTEQRAQIIKCASCDLHVPKHEAIERNGKHYCCEQHTPD